MNSQLPSRNTARRTPSAPIQAHGRSHSLSDPLSYSPAQPIPSPSSASACTSEFHSVQSIPPAIPNWQHATSGVGASISALPGASTNSSSETTMDVSSQPHVARGAASPQSMVSSGSPKGRQPYAARSSSADSAARPSSSRANGKKSSIDRNRRPCGACSSSKRKCKLISNVPNLCERCKNNGLAECPPHISWTTRRQNMAESGSLSPLEVDDAAFSSRSASPGYPGGSRSPVEYPAVFQSPNEHGVYADVGTNQERVHAQMLAQGQGSPSSAEMGLYEPFLVAQGQGQYPSQPQNAVGLQLPLHIQQPNASLNPAVLPVCHVCQTPYNEYHMLRYALAQWSASIPLPPYELDQTILKMHGHVPPGNDAPYQNQY